MIIYIYYYRDLWLGSTASGALGSLLGVSLLDAKTLGGLDESKLGSLGKVRSDSGSSGGDLVTRLDGMKRKLLGGSSSLRLVGVLAILN